MARLVFFGGIYIYIYIYNIRYSIGEFSLYTPTTIGVDYVQKLLSMDDGKEMRLKIWDTAGQERFRTIAYRYYKNSQGVLLVFDVTKRESFDNINNWIANINMHAASKIIKYLIGNKVDKEDERVVSESEARDLADQYDMKYYESSAMQNKGIDTSIQSIAKEIYANRHSFAITSSFVLSPPSKKVTNNGQKNKKNSKCC